MKRRSIADFRGSFSMSAGWLFADLLLVLAMLFLAANTMGIHPPPPTPTPTPIVHVTPPPQQRVLEHTYCEIFIDDNDATRFSTDINFAEQIFEPQILAKAPYLNGRQVGLAIASGGTDADNTGLGISLAAMTYRVLQDMGNKGSIFKVTSYYGALFSLGTPSRKITLDIYLIVRSDTATDTCRSDNHQPV